MRPRRSPADRRAFPTVRPVDKRRGMGYTGRGMQIRFLEKDRWAGHVLPMPDDVLTEHYRVESRRTEEGFFVRLCPEKLPAPRVRTPEAYGFPDRLYAPHFPSARAYGAFCEDALAGVVEICPEEWSNRMRVTELWVAREFRRRGIGSALLQFAKEEARREKRRALLLETQSCNVGAIAFYLKEGLSLFGFDACCYSNEDIPRGEVRLELGMYL